MRKKVLKGGGGGRKSTGGEATPKNVLMKRRSTCPLSEGPKKGNSVALSTGRLCKGERKRNQ